MEKIIIQNETDLPMTDAMVYVKHVISHGRISKDETQYCYVTTWPDGVIVYADKNKKSDRFIVRCH